MIFQTGEANMFLWPTNEDDVGHPADALGWVSDKMKPAGHLDWEEVGGSGLLAEDSAQPHEPCRKLSATVSIASRLPCPRAQTRNEYPWLPYPCTHAGLSIGAQSD